MNWQNDKAVGNDGVIYGTVYGTVYRNPLSIDTRYEAFAQGLYVGFDVDRTKLRRKVEATLLRRLFKHQWRLNILQVNGAEVGHYELYGDSNTNLGYVGTTRIFRHTLNGLKLAMVAEAKRQFLSQL